MALALLSAMIPTLPTYIGYVADLLLLIYIFNGVKCVSAVFMRWVFMVVGFFMLSAVWALKMNTALFGVIQTMFAFIPAIATNIYLTNLAKIRKFFFVFYAVSLVMMLYAVTIAGIETEGQRFGKVLNEASDVDASWNSNSISMNLCFALFAGYILFMKGKLGFTKLFYIFIRIQ